MLTVGKTKILPFLLCVALLTAMLPVLPRSAGAADQSARLYDFEDGTTMGWTKGNGSAFGTPPEVQPASDLARAGNTGAMRVNVNFTGGSWDEAGAKVSLLPDNLNNYGSLSYDIYVPAAGFDGTLGVQTIVNWPWTELGTLDKYAIADYEAQGYKTELIGGTAYVVIHKTDSPLPAGGQPELFVRLVGMGSAYKGPIYIDNVELKPGAPSPEPDPVFTGTVYEAEDAQLTGTVVENTRAGFSGTGYVTSFDNDGDAVTFTVNVPSGGTFPLSIGFNAPYGGKVQNIVVNGATVAQKSFPQTTAFKETAVGNVILKAGPNTVTILKNWGWMEVDYIRIGESVPRPDLKPVPPTLNNPYASASSKALMSYLTQVYGKKILSGQQVGVFNELKFIQSISGKLPAIASFDMLEQNSELDAIKWASYGGIVEFSWHWRAPMGGDDFYTSNTTFDIRRAVTPGTEENTLILQNIDTIAARLKKLSDAGVPVLWRPLHEAEGGWFWWGAHGAVPYKQLYNIVYDRLTKYHKLDNLIWTYTSGTTDQSPGWYPGGDKIDIAGMDKYVGGGDYSPLLADFDYLVDMVDGNKLIAYTENGPIPDPVQLQDNKVGWLYFNTWSGEFILDGKQNDVEHINAIYNSDYVITLDELPSQDIYGRTPEPAPPREPLPATAPVPDGYTMYEAENGTTAGTVVSSMVRGYSGTGYVTGFYKPTDAVDIQVNATEAGEYDLLVRYNGGYGDKFAYLIVNGENAGEKPLPNVNTYADISWGSIRLNQGANTIRILNSWGYFSIDAVLIKQLDRTPPVTTAAVSGETHNGWHTDQATITLSATDDRSGVRSTAYNTDGAGWLTYSSPIVMNEEGVHTVQYRSTDAEGNVEPVQSVTVSIDKTAPAFTLYANGNVLSSGTVIEDSQAVILELDVSDALSGVAGAAVTVDGKPYAEGTPLDCAGRLGKHVVKITVSDKAGNQTASSAAFKVTTSLPSLSAIFDRYAASGEIKDPPAHKLKQRLVQAGKALASGKEDKAADHLRKLLEDLNDYKNSASVTLKAKTVLTIDALYVIESLKLAR